MPDTSPTADEPNPVEGRIIFHGNPWPDGHRVLSCTWTASIDPRYGPYLDGAPPGPGMAIAFDLTTSDYDEADGPQPMPDYEDDDEPVDDWQAKGAWRNFGRCWIGASQTSSTPGIKVSDGRTPFVFDQEEYHFSPDPLPIEHESLFSDCAFGVYLLGYDALADHKIHLHSRQPDGSYTLDWTGKIALAYVGKTTFDYSFSARVTGVRFDAISLWYFDPVVAKEQLDLDLDPSLTPRDYIAPFVADPDRFRFEMRNNCLHAVRMDEPPA